MVKSTRIVALFAAMVKRENFEWIAEKATECGAAIIIPLLTARTIKSGFQRHRLERIIKEAAGQSGRDSVPKIQEPLDFKNAAEFSAREGYAGFFLDGTAQSSRADFSGQKKIALFIGPETGWTDEERALAKQNNLTPISLGPLVLSADTAAIVATYMAAMSNG